METIADYLKREVRSQLVCMLNYLDDDEKTDQEKYEALVNCLCNLKLCRRRIENECEIERYVSMRAGGLDAATLREMADDAADLYHQLFAIINEKTEDRYWLHDDTHPLENDCAKAILGIYGAGAKLHKLAMAREQEERREYLQGPELPFAQ